MHLLLNNNPGNYGKCVNTASPKMRTTLYKTQGY